MVTCTSLYTAGGLAREMDGFIFSLWDELAEFRRAAQLAGLVLILVVGDDCEVCGAISDSRVLRRYSRVLRYKWMPESFPICQAGFYPDWGCTIDMNLTLGGESEMEAVLERYFAERAAIDKITVYPVTSGDGWKVEISTKSVGFAMSSDCGEVAGLVVELRDLAPKWW